MVEPTRNVSDKTLRAWIRQGAVDRGIGDGLTFISTAASSSNGKASWVLRYRYGKRSKELVIGRYPDISLKDARETARKNRALIQQGIDVAAAKREMRLQIQQQITVTALAKLWYERDITKAHKRPELVTQSIVKHIQPVIGKLDLIDVKPIHIDKVLTRTMDLGGPAAAKKVLNFLSRMFHLAVKHQRIERNPVYGFNASDVGGTRKARERWLNSDELAALATAMRNTSSFDRRDELAVWLLLALCVRKMELLAAKWEEFDLKRGVWNLDASRTKTKQSLDIPLAAPVLRWLCEVREFSFESEFLFPTRQRFRSGNLGHIGATTLNFALTRLPLGDMAHFCVHDLRRTARTHLAAHGVDRVVAERALNHKLSNIEGVYNRYDYFEERKIALARWAEYLEKFESPTSIF